MLFMSRSHPHPSGLTASHLPPDRGKAFGRPKAAPTEENKPGALARQSQARVWNRSNSNFCKGQGLVAREKSPRLLKFCAPKIFCLIQGITPRNGGPGGGRIWARSAHPEPTPWCLFGFFLGIQKEARRPQAAKLPCINQNPQRLRALF